MSTFYSQQRPVIENGDLVFITNGGSRELIGSWEARRQLASLEKKSKTRPLADSTRARIQLLRNGIALFEANIRG